MPVSDLIGWLATAIFGTSYFVRSPVTMRWVQAGAAVCWIVYGVLLHAAPVITANLIVATLAIYSSWRSVGPRPGTAVTGVSRELGDSSAGPVECDSPSE